MQGSLRNSYCKKLKVFHLQQMAAYLVGRKATSPFTPASIPKHLNPDADQALLQAIAVSKRAMQVAAPRDTYQLCLLCLLPCVVLASCRTRGSCRLCPLGTLLPLLASSLRGNLCETGGLGRGAPAWEAPGGGVADDRGKSSPGSCRRRPRCSGQKKGSKAIKAGAAVQQGGCDGGCGQGVVLRRRKRPRGPHGGGMQGNRQGGAASTT